MHFAFKRAGIPSVSSCLSLLDGCVGASLPLTEERSGGGNAHAPELQASERPVLNQLNPSKTRLFGVKTGSLKAAWALVGGLTLRSLCRVNAPGTMSLSCVCMSG